MALSDFSLFGNNGEILLIALGIFIGLIILFLLFDRYLVVFLKKGAKKTKIRWDDLIIDFIGAINWQFYGYIALYVALQTLVLPDLVGRVLLYLLIVFVFYYASQGFSRIIDHFTEAQIEKRKKSDNAQNTSMIKTFGGIFKAIIYILALLLVLSNLGIEITPLIASLGVGGIAIAIALQSVLADLFAAFSIYFDKPFQEGDFIIIGDDLGTIKKIGIKSTRIETLQGQELIVSNTELTSTRVNNYKRMQKRRVVFHFGVEYSTPVKKLKKINELIKKVVKETRNADLDRVHFKAFGDFSLNYEVVYYVPSADYNMYMDVQQELNLKIKEALEKEKIEFAFPTQTLHIDSFKKK